MKMAEVLKKTELSLLTPRFQNENIITQSFLKLPGGNFIQLGVAKLEDKIWLKEECRMQMQRDCPFSTYAKFSGKINISYSLTRLRTYAYQGVRNVNFLENFACILNGWPQMVQLIMMNILATIVRVIMLVLQELLPIKGLGYLGPISRVIHKEEETMLGQFILHFTYFLLLKYCF